MVQALATLFVLSTASAGGIENDYRSREWTDYIRGGLVPYHQLTFESFRVADPRHERCDAYTMGFIQFRYESEVTGEGPYIANVKKLRVWSGLDRNQTWRRPWINRSHPFLSHEQHHLDLNELAATRFAQIPADLLPTGRGRNKDDAKRDLAMNLNRLFRMTMEGVQREHDQYDRETRGGEDPRAQVDWSNKVTAALRSAGIRATWSPDNR